MTLLLALPVWVIFLNFIIKPDATTKANAKAYMILCSTALILVMGLRDRSVGTMDTFLYCRLFEYVKDSQIGLYSFLENADILNGNLLLSEAGFYIYVWLLAKVLPGTQWFLFVTAAIIIALTAKFIWDNSENYSVSWIVFICLGSMTFAMNGMRQALAMSICLAAYKHARQRRICLFAVTLLAAVLFHKSAILFIVVYFMSGMKINSKSLVIVVTGVVLFFISADRLTFLYSTMTGEDYLASESFEGGGTVTVLIYLIVIAFALLCTPKARKNEIFVPMALVAFGFGIYMCRYFSAQIYERVSYYFFYFLMILFPAVFHNFRRKDRALITACFVLCAVVLYAYRISKGGFANFRLFW